MSQSAASAQVYQGFLFIAKLTAGYNQRFHASTDLSDWLLPEMPKLLLWNIQQGGGPRRQAIADSTASYSPDVVALLEFIPRAACPLLQSFQAQGFQHHHSTHRNGQGYAICVLAKTPFTARRSGIPFLDDSGQYLQAHLPAYRLNLGIVHAPTTPRTRMKQFLDALILVARSPTAPDLFIGDFNTGIGPADGPMRNFGDVDRFTALQTAGFTDVWRHRHGDKIEHTWARAAKAYRIDHALASRQFLDRIDSCHYSHDERLAKLSDHSLLTVEFDRNPLSGVQLRGITLT